jgi:phage shock protein A
MALNLFDRSGTLLRADAHGVVESLEERGLLLKQHLREAELALDQHRARLDAVREDEKALRDALARREHEVRALDDDVTLALGGGKEELARFALRRLLPKRKELATLRARLAERAAEAEELAQRTERQQAQLVALRARVRAEASERSPTEEVQTWMGEPPVADEEIELELMRRRAAAGGAS